ncbi:P-loop containing nucleoside triphosphate hydrolase protein [Tothia fuscella]|uniref:RNA helicase n=1 Tax=Tothia fuscella TaxID=1048955 RepID=A0A9P4P1M6_9PEZI|nr:P-loop containing nucleoside triphosphate hydrolase protein [Tothia fuscella]
MSDDFNFETADMSAAIDDVEVSSSVAPSTASCPKPEQNFVGAPEDDAEAEAKARGHNWVPKTNYDYSSYAIKDKNSVEVGNMPAWAASAVKYEWSDDFGDVAPRVEELEKQLFTTDFLAGTGTAMKALELEVRTEGPKNVKPVLKFSEAGLHPVLMETLKLMHYDEPTPIQAYTIPAVLLGSDVVASAQTGSGKTAAYLIPILSRLMGKAQKLCAPRPNPVTYNPSTDAVRAEPLVLIVAPTRELVCQIFDEARRLCYRSKLRPCVAYGGGPMGLQREELNKGCDILIATPGRLIDFMRKPALLTLARLKYTIIDEADEMMTADWEENMTQIMGGDSNEDPDHIYMMFSATFPKEMRKVARKYMEPDYFRIYVGRIGSTHKNIEQSICWVEENKKRDALYDLLFSEKPARTIIFVNSKRQADMIDDFLFNKGLPTTSIHSDRTQREREDAILAFKQGTCPILVTTGVAARGIDIRNVMHVINYDMPSADHGGIQEYVHRIGRTARIGYTGKASSFYNNRNEDIAEDLVKLLIENGQLVPDFLEDHRPLDGGKIEFDDDSEPDSDEADEATGGDAWGAAPVDDGFKADEGFAADDGFKADEGGFKADAGDDA